MLSVQAEKWVREGRRHVDMAICSQTGTPKITIWAYDFDVMQGTFVDANDPQWPSTEELKLKRVVDLKRQMEEAAA